MDISAQFRILHDISRRSIPETAEMLGEKTRNVDNWVKSMSPRDADVMPRMEASDDADAQWVADTVNATVNFIEEMEKAQGVPPDHLTMSYYQTEKDYMSSPNGLAVLGIPYRQYYARIVRVYAVLSYLGYRVEFSYIVM